VAEGYEESERELVEQATHAEDRWVPEPFTPEGGEDRLPPEPGETDVQELVPESPTDRVQPSYGDPDAIAPTEVRSDVREETAGDDSARPHEATGPSVDRAAARRRLATGLSIARTAIGAAFLLAPSLAGPGWIGRAARKPGARIVTAGLGARDVALGVGTLAALRSGDAAARPWLCAQFASDLGDFAATLVHGRGVGGRPRLGALVLSGGASVAGGIAAFVPGE
jgi:hypothetical protein